jgi:hypothetical protein
MAGCSALRPDEVNGGACDNVRSRPARVKHAPSRSRRSASHVATAAGPHEAWDSSRPRVIRSPTSKTGTGAARSTGWVHAADSLLVTAVSTFFSGPVSGSRGRSAPNHKTDRRGRPRYPQDDLSPERRGDAWLGED